MTCPHCGHEKNPVAVVLLMGAAFLAGWVLTKLVG